MALFVDIEKQLGKFQLKVKFETENKVLAILGASGCGKSMTLKCIAGVEKPDKGRIVLDGVTLFDSEQKIDLPPQKRRVGYLFQQYALFPNMTVAQNIACGVREKSKRREKTAEILQLIGLTGMEKKRPYQLSGGQQQRVALARILVNEPEVLLLDEPFSSLDTHLRFHLERQVQEMLERFGKTVIFVSHDRDEAYRLAQEIAIMAEGCIECIGEKKAIFQSPKTRTGAVLTGCKNISRAKWVDETHVHAVDWDLILEVLVMESAPEYVGIRMHDIRVISSESRSDLRHASTEHEAVEKTAKSLEQNRIACQVMGEIEEPFAYTVQLRPEGKAVDSFLGISLSKEKWNEIRGQQLVVCLPKECLLLLSE